jgi:hypothetical protein
LSDRGVFRYSNLHTGAYIGYNFNGLLGMDIGVYYQRSSAFYALMYDHEVDFLSKVSAPMYLDIPILIRYFYDLPESSFSIVPSIGISVLTHFSGVGLYGSDEGDFEFTSLAGLTNADVNSSGGRTGSFGYLLRTGIGIEYDIPIRFPLTATCNLNYSQGLRNIDQILITTSISENPETSVIKYDGSGWMASLGLRIPILLGKDNRKCGAMPRIRYKCSCKRHKEGSNSWKIIVSSTLTKFREVLPQWQIASCNRPPAIILTH